MANDAPSDDSEEFVFRTGPRSGLKREFAFALRVHTEVSGSLGRTRSRKILSSLPCNGVSPDSSNKRVKPAGAGDAVAEDSEKGVKRVKISVADDATIEESKKSGKILSPPSCNGIFADICYKRMRTSKASKVDVAMAEESKRENGSEENLVKKVDSGLPCAEVVDKKNDLEELPIKKEDPGTEIRMEVDHRGSGLEDSPIKKEYSGAQTAVAVLDSDAEKMDGEVEIAVVNGSLEMLVDGVVEKAVGTEVENLVEADAEKALARNMEKVVEGDAEKVVVDGNMEKVAEGDGEVVLDGNEGKMVDGNGLLPEKMVDNDGEEIVNGISRSDRENVVDGDAELIVNENGEKVVAAKAGNVVDGSAEKMNNDDAEKMRDGNAMKTPLPTLEKGFTQSLDEKMVDGDERMTVDGNGDRILDDNIWKTPPAFYPPPARRITRSLLKINKDSSTSTSSVMDSGSAISEPNLQSCKNEAVIASDTKMAGEVSPLRGSSKKLELKMSKKITLTKMPSNMRDLLATGLLEGLPVKYIFRCNKSILQGTIKGDGILCSCSSCNGSKVVLPFEFEKHAGSLNKHPSQYIHFENGKTIREVLIACKRAPLDMLEATIQTELGFTSVKDDSISHNGKESNQSRVTESASVRSKGSPSDQSQESPASSAVSARVKTTRLKPKSSDNTAEQPSSQKKNGHGRLTKKDLRLHKLVFSEGVLPAGTEVAYYARGQRLLEGYISNNLIFCQCCSAEISPSQFEAHAGWASRRKPYLHIYTSNGVSLHELSVSLSKGRKFSANDNDDLCSICADGGDLLLCDGCPRAFHKDCVGLSSLPRGDWYCKYCQNLFEKEKAVAYNANALAAGRVLGVDPIEQITKRCIRIFKTKVSELTVCVLCRSHEFSKSGFGPRTVLLCDQCEKEYHVGCLKDHKMADLKELPEGKWFCCDDCNKIHTALHKLVLRGSEALPNSLSDVIRKKQDDKPPSNCADLDVRWRLLSGKIPSSDTRLLLSKAVAIFHDCFDPIVDSASGRDLIPSIVYGRNLRDQEFGGMYCAVLTVNSTVVCAAIIRIFGQEVAELPLVATSTENQGKGYFQSLFSCIERLLGFLRVKNLLLPAADEAESIWTKKFGFKKINQDELSKLTKDFRMMSFQGTSMLHKLVPKCRIVGKPAKGS